MLRARAAGPTLVVQGFILNERTRFPQARLSLSEVETQSPPQIFHN